MKKIMRIGTIKTCGGRGASVYIKAEITESEDPKENGKLSISGVIYPLSSGNCLGGYGQIDMEFDHRNKEDNDSRYEHPIKTSEINFARGWNAPKWLDLLDIWKHYHLNDMNAGCEHQRAAGWDKIKLDESKPLTQDNMATWTRPEDNPKGLLTKACPVCGYKYGTAWLKVELPQKVIEFLQSLPDSDKEPAWV